MDYDEKGDKNGFWPCLIKNFLKRAESRSILIGQFLQSGQIRAKLCPYCNQTTLALAWGWPRTTSQKQSRTSCFGPYPRAKKRKQMPACVQPLLRLEKMLSGNIIETKTDDMELNRFLFQHGQSPGAAFCIH